MAATMGKDLPGAAGNLARQHGSVWDAYAVLGAATAEAGGPAQPGRSVAPA